MTTQHHAAKHDDEGLRRIKYDPHAPHAAKTAGSSSVKNPVDVPWPSGQEPKAKKVTAAKDSPLPKADALVVTWTSGEARTMGQLFAGTQLEDWNEYTNNVAAFIPKVTGKQAPFNDNSKYMERYYHVLGLWCVVELAGKTIVVVKSGLHPAYDGPAVPMVDLWKQMVAQVQPQLVITTGTGGGIGADVLLGDVLLASHVRWDCTGPLKGETFANAEYACPSINESKIASLITPALLKPNGDRLMTPRIPNMIYPSAANSNQVTTDTFAFDDSTDHFKLQALGKCCDMGDAALGLAMSQTTNPPTWAVIRNASDPQIKNTSGLEAAKKEAETIYNDYQCITTASSVIATWATLLAQLG